MDQANIEGHGRMHLLSGVDAWDDGDIAGGGLTGQNDLARGPDMALP